MGAGPFEVGGILLQWGRAELRGKGFPVLGGPDMSFSLQWGRAELRGKGAS